MRTRSQQASPGGFLSLDDNGTTRRTRATRSASQPSASQETTSQESAPQESDAQPNIEPSAEQPATRSRGQRAAKSTTTKRANRVQKQTASKRATRRNTRKPRNTVTDSGREESIENDDAAQVETTENREEDAKDPKPTTRASDNTLLEPKSSELNRKRSHTEGAQLDPETPRTNKRRNLGTPGSTPFARRATPLSRRMTTTTVPYSERLRRRRAESQGRIHRTVFRLPQLVAQAEADRRASESPLLDSRPEPLQTSFTFSVNETQPETNVSDQLTHDEPNEPAAPQEPSTPEPSSRGWNIRGLLSSVPRSFSRFLPSFTRSPERLQSPVTQLPSSERASRTQASGKDLTTLPRNKETQSRRRSSEQPPAKRARNLSYSLFPAPIDRDLYLGDVPRTSTAASTSITAEQETRKKDESENSNALSSQTSVTGGRVIEPENGKEANEMQKKRKRSPSPDVIPNPAGSSYGLDLDYFCYSSESDEEKEELSAPRTEPKKTIGAFNKRGARAIIQSERPASKKVRFDASPEDTPSKLRIARATDPYRGRHFIGMGASQSVSAPSTPTPTFETGQPTKRSSSFIPNRQGTFQLDYDDFSDDSESSGAPSPAPLSAPVSAPTTPETRPSTQSNTTSLSIPPTAAPRQTPRQTPAPTTPAKVDDEALARARSQAEKYKPKTPSGLRTTSRYSSPLNATPDTNSTTSAGQMIEKFGDDEFAKDAQWLFDNCPSGDLSQLKWPTKQTLAESFNIRPSSLQILNDIWDQSEMDRGYNAFKQSLNEFEKTFA